MHSSLIKSITQESSLHGVRHITDERRSRLSRFFWLLAFLGSVCGLVLSGYNVYLKWNVDPETGLRVNYRPMTELPFPAVTICSNVFARNFMANFTRLTDPDAESSQRGFTPSEQNYLAANIHRCLPANSSHITRVCNNRTRLDTVNLMRESSTNTKDFLRSCMLRGILTNCSVIVNRILTDYGFCYNFNMLDYEQIFNHGVSKDFQAYRQKVRNHTDKWTLEQGYLSDDEKDVFPIRLSKTNTLSLYFYLNESDTLNNCQATGRVFTIILHQPSEIPTVFHEELYIPYGNRKTVILTARIYKSADSLRKYKPEKRDCYFEGERQLRFFRSYTKAHCDFECMTNYTLAECGCVKFSMPRSDDMPVCDVDKLDCYTNAMMEWPQNAKTETPCSCFPTCSFIKYGVHFQKDAVMGEFMRFSPAAESRSGTHSFLYIRTKSHAVDEYETFAAYRLQNFIADFGGLLGLFLGCSILSLIELIFFTVAGCWKIKLRKSDVEKSVVAHSKPQEGGKSIQVHPRHTNHLIAFEQLNLESYASRLQKK